MTIPQIMQPQPQTIKFQDAQTEVTTGGNDKVLGREDSNTSGDDEDDEFDVGAHGVEERTLLVGVSISKTQSRLKSPLTPAVEKMAVMAAQPDSFDDPIGEVVGSDFDHQDALPGPRAPSPPVSSPQTTGTSLNHAIKSESNTVGVPNREPSPKPPSPWRAGPKAFERREETGQLLGSVFRKRSSSSPQRKTWLPLTLPNLPKARIFGASSDPAKAAQSGTRGRDDSRGISQVDGSNWSRESWNDLMSRARGQFGANDRPSQSDTSLTPAESSFDASTPTQREATLDQGTKPRPKLGPRRVTSDQSLYLNRTLSKASSLGDDSRFENVHEQLNSRLKAIRDSWQDSNLRRNLQGLPKPSFSGSRIDLSVPWDSSKEYRKSLVANGSSSAEIISGSERSNIDKGMQNVPNTVHPLFTQALQDLEGDIVVLGGYRGSILREAQAPHRRVWLPLLKAGLNLKKVDLEVDFDDDGRATNTVIPGGMLTHIGPVDISRRLLKRLRGCENARNGRLRVHEYGYDWRLSPQRLSRQLVSFLEKLPSNHCETSVHKRGATVIAHSLGGLITRWAVNSRPELFAGVVYAGVPQTCVNILGCANGDDVLFSSKVLTAQINLSIRTSIVLLPLNGRCFIDKDTNEEYPVDFYDPEDWIKYRWSPCTDPPLPALAQSIKPTGLIGAVSTMIPDSLVSAMPTLMNRRESNAARGSNIDIMESEAKTTHADAHAQGVPNAGMAPQMGPTFNESKQISTNAATGITISREKAIEYLRRTLPEIKRFREELAHDASLQEKNLYPPLAVIYGKTEPTVSGARVRGRDGIARADAYSSLAFASGDGVVLSRAAQLPTGYKAVRGGVVASERGHVTLLGDLEAIGKCLVSLQKARRAGVGSGLNGREGQA